MTAAALELVDAAVTLAVADAVVATSPGVALLDPAGVLVGSAAQATQRLKPVLAVDRYWSELTTAPLPRGVAGARSHADLAYVQLRELAALAPAGAGPWLYVVPATMKAPELALLAGIGAAAGIAPAACVDLAVAACATLPGNGPVLHLDLQLHQAVLTLLDGGPVLARRDLRVAARTGLKPLHAAWAQLVGETFVRRTRFDPLHQAATEQAVFDALPGWLAALQREEFVELVLEHQGTRYAAPLKREPLIFAAEAYYTQLVELVSAALRGASSVTLAVGDRAASLPGLLERLTRLSGVDVIALPPGAAVRGALAAESHVVGPSLALVTQLPRGLAPAVAGGLAARTAGHGA